MQDFSIKLANQIKQFKNPYHDETGFILRMQEPFNHYITEYINGYQNQETNSQDSEAAVITAKIYYSNTVRIYS